MTRVRLQIWVVLAAGLAAVCAAAVHRWATSAPAKAEWAPRQTLAISANWLVYLPPERMRLAFCPLCRPALRTVFVSGTASARQVPERAAFRTAPLPSRAPPAVSS